MTIPAPEAPGGIFGDPAEFLTAARDRILRFHRGSDASGTRTTHLYTAAVDNTLRGLFAGALADGAVDGAWAEERFCLVASGGYARRALSPFSDVDLLLLTDGPAPEPLEAMTRALLYPLWNEKLQVGRHAGDLEEVLARGEEDETLRMTLLDVRYLAGSRALYARFLERSATVLDAHRASMLARVHPINFARFRRYGDSVFLLEPNVKEGKGGLRDYHWLGWVSRLKYGLRGDYDLLLSGLVEPDHYRSLVEAHEFLLRVRIQLHAIEGRHRDRLRFEVQEPVARALGFQGRRGLKAVERFMGAYYRHAYAMAHLCGLYVARMLDLYWDEEAPAPVDDRATGVLPAVDPARRGAEGPLRLGPSAPVARADRGLVRVSEDGLFRQRLGAVVCEQPGCLQKRPHKLLDLFLFLQQHGGRLHHDTIEEVREAARRRVDARFRSDPAHAEAFRRILEGPDVFRILVAMHRSGFLGRWLPEFGATFCQAQHNRVHLYTVDVHCLYAVRELAALDEPDAREGASLFAEAWARSAARGRGPVLLAALLHDIAKAHGAAHSRVGAEMVPGILGRLGYDAEAVERTQWLVRHHLVLTDLAYHRDLMDPATQQRLRAIVESPEHLDDLFALTWADSRATNAQLFTSWKRTLLEQAYRVTRSLLGADGAEEDAEERRDALLARTEALVAVEVGRKRAPELVRRLVEDPGSAATLDQADASVLATHALLVDGVLAGGAPVTSHARPLVEQGASEWTVCTRDRPGVFALLAGVLFGNGLSIASAETITRDDGAVIDTFYVRDLRGQAVDDPARWRRVDRALERALETPDALQALVERARRSWPPAAPAGAQEHKRVVVTNDESERATVVEVVTQDRPGLLYDIACVLRDFHLDLRLAKVATRLDLASDSFYVVDRKGRRLGRSRRAALEGELRERFA